MSGPYPGPRPFLADEASIFFGRTREESQLRSLVLGHSLVLLYAESGAGKTSLVSAGVIPALHDENVTVFPILRIRPSYRSEEDDTPVADNPFVTSMAKNWALQHGASSDGIDNLADLIALLERTYQAPVDEPRVLVIDQFEELFTQFPEQWEKRGDFFAQLEDAITKHPDLRVLLAMREDFLAQTDPYVGILTNRLQHRCRIERLRREQAIEAVTKPLGGTGRAFGPGAAEHLVEQLLQIRLERETGVVEIPGEFVEPVQLQIVCSSLWERLEALPQKTDTIRVEHIDQLVPVKRALANFYGEVVARTAAQRGIDVLELRDWCETELITEGGTRALVYRGAHETAGMLNEVVETLEAEHLLRREERAGAFWYELSHDKFVEAIESGNRRAFEEHAKVASELNVQAETWVRRIDEAISALRSTDTTEQQDAMSTVYAALASGVELSSDRRFALESLLDELARTSPSGGETQRLAQFLKSLVEPGVFDEERAFRTSYAGSRFVTVELRGFAGAIVLLALFLGASLLGVVELTEWLVSTLWSDPPELSFNEQWLTGASSMLWLVIYGAETFENFPLTGWRRSEHTILHTLTAPWAPWRDGDSIVAGWPLNIILPWFAAAMAGTAAHVYLDWRYTLIFVPVYATLTALIAMAYWDSQF